MITVMLAKQILFTLATLVPACAQNNGALAQFSQSVQALAARVSPSVVEISVTRFAPQDDSDSGHTGVVLGVQQVVGSGAIIDPDGYIITNAHVVSNALRIRVQRLAHPPATADSGDQAIADSLAQALAPEVDATLVGVYKDLDVALIKIRGRVCRRCVSPNTAISGKGRWCSRSAAGAGWATRCRWAW